MLLILSALLQAFEVVYENKYFADGTVKTSLFMQGGVATWKMIFTAAVLPFVGLIHVPEEYVTGGRLESLGMAVTTLYESREALCLMMLMVLANSIQAYIGMAIIENESAMLRQISMMMLTPVVWLYFLIVGRETPDNRAWELLGMFMVTAGSLWYVHSEREVVIEQESLATQQEEDDEDLTKLIQQDHPE